MSATSPALRDQAVAVIAGAAGPGATLRAGGRTALRAAGEVSIRFETSGVPKPVARSRPALRRNRDRPVSDADPEPSALLPPTMSWKSAWWHAGCSRVHGSAQPRRQAGGPWEARSWSARAMIAAHCGERRSLTSPYADGIPPRPSGRPCCEQRRRTTALGEAFASRCPPRPSTTSTRSAGRGVADAVGVGRRQRGSHSHHSRPARPEVTEWGRAESCGERVPPTVTTGVGRRVGREVRRAEVGHGRVGAVVAGGDERIWRHLEESLVEGLRVGGRLEPSLTAHWMRVSDSPQLDETESAVLSLAALKNASRKPTSGSEPGRRRCSPAAHRRTARRRGSSRRRAPSRPDDVGIRCHRWAQRRRPRRNRPGRERHDADGCRRRRAVLFAKVVAGPERP